MYKTWPDCTDQSDVKNKQLGVHFLIFLKTGDYQKLKHAFQEY